MRRLAESGSIDAGSPVVVVAASDVANFMAKRFRPVPCSDGLASDEARADWRDSICEQASDPDERYQKSREQALGERPAVLCGTAALVAGEWDRTK